jgi:hypothetical protein
LRHTSREVLQEMVANIAECQRLGMVRSGDRVTQALAILSTIHGFVSLVKNRIGQSWRFLLLVSIRDAILPIFRGLARRNPTRPESRGRSRIKISNSVCF